MTMENQKINTIGIKEWRHLHPKIGVGWCIKFKTNYTFDSQEKHGKQLQWNAKWKPMIKIS